MKGAYTWTLISRHAVRWIWKILALKRDQEGLQLKQQIKYLCGYISKQFYERTQKVVEKVGVDTKQMCPGGNWTQDTIQGKARAIMHGW